MTYWHKRRIVKCLKFGATHHVFFNKSMQSDYAGKFEQG